MTALGVDDAPVPPALIVERAERSGRLSVAFRLLLVLPQVVALLGLGLVGAVAVVAGWFAALVLGRLPEPIARYLCHFTRYSTRVSAYIWLLTDRYPPFRFSAEDYPVRVELAPGRLNRWAVLFRYVLAYPVLLLLSLVLAGWTVAAFFIWLVVLVAGRVPRPLFDATTAVLRYNMRCYAYLWLLTSAYPWGLFGDRAAPAGAPETAEATWAESGAWAGAAEPASGPGPAGVPGVTEEVPLPPPAPTPTTPPWPAPTAAAAAAATSGPEAALEPPRAPRGRLVLSTGAKRLVVLFIVLGVLQWAGDGAANAIVRNNTLTKAEALSALRTAHDVLGGRTQQFRQQVTTCRSTGDQLSCVKSASGQLADAFEAFAVQVDRLEFPSSAKDEAAEMGRVAHGFASAVRGLANASSLADYSRLAAGTEQLGNSFDQQYRALVAALAP